MPTKTMIHNGTSVITVAAKRELQEVPDLEAGEGAVKLEEVEVEPERQEKIKLPAGTRFGEYLIKTPYEIADPKLQKTLEARGFEIVNREEAKKLDARAEKNAAKSPEAVNAAAAADDRERAFELQRQHEPNVAPPVKKTDAPAAAAAAPAAKSESKAGGSK